MDRHSYLDQVLTQWVFCEYFPPDGVDDMSKYVPSWLDAVPVNRYLKDIPRAFIAASTTANYTQAEQLLKVLAKLLLRKVNTFSTPYLLYYAYGSFTRDSCALYFLSDDIISGCCSNGCKLLHSFNEFCWGPNKRSVNSLPHCRNCGVGFKLKLFFFGALHLKYKEHLLHLFFYSESSDNFFGVSPAQFARSRRVRYEFKRKVVAELCGHPRYACITYMQSCDMLFPLFVDYIFL